MQPSPATIEELKALLLEVIERLAAIEQRLDAPGPPAQNILPLKEAAVKLGYRNYEAAWRQISNGHYREGIEAIDRRPPNGTSPLWHLDIEKCLKRDRQPPAKRKP